MASREKTALEMIQEKDESYRRELLALFKTLRSQAVSNIEYFQDSAGSNNERFHSSFCKLFEHLEQGMEPAVNHLLEIAHQFDFDPSQPANGYRSFVKVIHKCCLHLMQLSRHITVNRDSFLFRSNHYSKQLEAYVDSLGQLRACTYYLKRLLEYCKDGDLFADMSRVNEEEPARLMNEVEMLSQDVFYGRCLGFQYCPSMRKPLDTIVLAMAAFSDGYGSSSTLVHIANSVIGGGKYMLDLDRRAERVVNVTKTKDIRFCKAFWTIAENDVLHTLPLFVCPPVQVDKVINIPPEPFELLIADGSRSVRITPPCAHRGPAPVSTRLISYELREGQEAWKIKGHYKGSPKVLPPSPGLIIQCHGGGFVAQSSASHEVYLRQWAKDTGTPIFCIDYSLAPENPFPRAFEEVFYVYCWALKNAHLLGSTGERIALVGDSAGGNLILATSLRVATYGLRKPDGLLCVYPSILVQYTPSPSRMLALMDPLLPVGILSQCLAAYAGLSTEGVPPFPIDALRKSPNTSTASTPGNKASTSCEAQTFNDNQSMETEENENNEKKSCEAWAKPSVVRAKTGSGDSGFDESAEGLNRNEVKSVEDSPKCGSKSHSEKMSDVKVDLDKDIDESEENHVHSADESACLDVTAECTRHNQEGQDHSQPPSQSQNTNLTSLVGKLKQGANSIDESHAKEPKNGQTSGSMKLDLNFLKSAMPKAFHKSPSSPAFQTIPAAVTGWKSPYGSPNSLLRNPLDYAQYHNYASTSTQYRHIPITKNAYMSPLLASDELLQELPPVYVACCHLDPMLDDAITFAKRLKSLNKEIHLDVFDDLPHGFLNFTLISQDARQGSEICCLRLAEILHLDDWEVYEYDDIVDIEGTEEIQET